MNTRTPLPVAVIAVAVALLGPGCTSTVPTGEPSSWQLAELNQKHDLDEVLRRAESLRPGMTRTEVLFLLGSPASGGETQWEYYPMRSGLFVPARGLRVRFVNGRFSESDRFSIVLGGELN